MNNTKIVKIKGYFLILLTTFNLFFPIFGMIFNIIYYLFMELTSKEKRVVFLNIVFSLAFLAFLYVRVNETGDIYKYGLSLVNYANSLLYGSRESVTVGTYESYYPFWYFMLYVTSKLGFNIQFINMIAIFTIYASWLYIVYDLDKKYKVKNLDKILFIKILTIISIIAIFSSYKTLWAFSLISLGLYLLMNKNLIGYIFLLLGMMLHPITWIVVIVYLISKFIKFKIHYLYISLLGGLLFKNFLQIFNSLLDIPFIGSKINTYIYGKWSMYRFYDNSEYAKFFLLVVIIVFLISIILILYKNKDSIQKDKYFIRYNNFIMWYFSLSLWFVSFRTIGLRLIEDAIILFFPLFYQFFMYKKNMMRSIDLIIVFLWVLMIDIRIFNIFNSAFVVGDGFPFNILSSPIIYFFKGVV
jgi:hypothetical protein